MGNVMDPSSGMGGGEFGQMGDPTQYLTPNDLISQRSSPDFMPGGTKPNTFLDFDEFLKKKEKRIQIFIETR